MAFRVSEEKVIDVEVTVEPNGDDVDILCNGIRVAYLDSDNKTIRLVQLDSEDKSHGMSLDEDGFPIVEKE